MKSILAAIVVVLLIGSTAYGGWYVGPRTAYYPAYYPAAPVYAYPAPYVTYSPVVPTPAYAYPAPYVAYSRVVPAPAPAWVGPQVVVVRPRVFAPWRPVRSVVRVVPAW